VVEIARHKAIVELLAERPFATVRDLQEAFGVSPATIRRDIDKLHGRDRRGCGRHAPSPKTATSPSPRSAPSPRGPRVSSPTAMR
jgi:DeoR/GlpR family transcriptional regulator of sugar metabolism